MTASCSNCGQEWDRDPAIEVPCPTCDAAVGEKCSRPSDHSGSFVHPHVTRDDLAMESIASYGMCPEGQSRRSDQHDGSVQQTLIADVGDRE